MATAASTGSSLNLHGTARLGMNVSRVTMLWPSDLKSDLQKKVGKRGLTAYVLDAVREKIAAEQDDRPKPLTCSACGLDLEPNGTCFLCG